MNVGDECTRCGSYDRVLVAEDRSCRCQCREIKIHTWHATHKRALKCQESSEDNSRRPDRTLAGCGGFSVQRTSQESYASSRSGSSTRSWWVAVGTNAQQMNCWSTETAINHVPTHRKEWGDHKGWAGSQVHFPKIVILHSTTRVRSLLCNDDLESNANSETDKNNTYSRTNCQVDVMESVASHRKEQVGANLDTESEVSEVRFSAHRKYGDVVARHNIRI